MINNRRDSKTKNTIVQYFHEKIKLYLDSKLLQMRLHRKWLEHEYYSEHCFDVQNVVLFLLTGIHFYYKHILNFIASIFFEIEWKIKSKPRCGITPRYSQKQHRIKEEFVCEYFSKTEKCPTIFIETNVNPCSIKFLFEGNYFWNTGRGWRKGGQLTKQEGPWSNWLPPPPTHITWSIVALAHTQADICTMWGNV